MSREILKLIAAETFGESYQAHKIELDLESDTSSRIDNQEPLLENPKLGETAKVKGYRSLKKSLDRIFQTSAQILTYFLDGSRHVYKIDDIAYQHGSLRKMVYPIVAGQVTVGCCRRADKKMFAENFLGEIVLVLPDVANFDNQEGFIPELTRKINDKLAGKNLPVKISKILEYSTSRAEDEKFEDRAIAKVQNHMYQAEQNMVADLVARKKLNQQNYLVKDGSLEYRIPSKVPDNKRIMLRFKNNYDYVIGVSKKFNPALWTGVDGRPNPGFIAELPLYHRTPVLQFENPELHGDLKFVIWYVRLREKSLDSPFDGVVKLEKILVTQEETETGKIESDLADYLSAHIINERNPVCYGSDNRWANHIYPVFVTETFAKSKCIAADTFLHLF